MFLDMFNLNILFDPLEQFEIEFFNSYFLSTICIYLLLILFFFFVFASFVKYNSSVVVSGALLLNHQILLFLDKLVKENISYTKYNYYIIISSMFYFITFSNILGMIPYSFTLTSHLSITFFTAFFLFLGINFVGIDVQRKNIFELFLPAGTPLPVMPFLVIIEVISYIARVFSLSIRLFANMMSGHTLLKILCGFTWSIFFSLSTTTYIFLGIFPLAIVFVVTGLEFVIAFLQAYVFITLVSIYLNDVLNLH